MRVSKQSAAEKQMKIVKKPYLISLSKSTKRMRKGNLLLRVKLWRATTQRDRKRESGDKERENRVT